MVATTFIGSKVAGVAYICYPATCYLLPTGCLLPMLWKARINNSNNQKGCNVMAPTNDQKEKFIDLRARGYSFDKIAPEIGVSKPTLLKWQEEFKREIANLEFIDFQTLLEQHRLNRRARFEETASLLEKVNKAIEGKDLNSERLKDLLKMKEGLEESLGKLKRGSIAYTGIIEKEDTFLPLDGEETEITLNLD